MRHQFANRQTQSLALTNGGSRNRERLVVEQVDRLVLGVTDLFEGSDHLYSVSDLFGDSVNQFVPPHVRTVEDHQMGKINQFPPPIP